MTIITARRIGVLAAVVAANSASPLSVVAQATGAAPAGRHPDVTLAMAPDHFLIAGDVRLRYREIGRGEPVVLLHGATRDLESWEGFADRLAVDHRVIALDQRGHGKSSRFTDRTHFGLAMVEDVVRLLDHLHIQRAHLVGHSLGAVVAANVTARHPRRVATASLVSPPMYADSAAYMRAHEAGIADLARGAGMARLNQLVFPDMSDSMAKAASASILANIPAPTLAAMFGSVSSLMLPRSAATAVRGVPTLVMVGTADPLLGKVRALAGWWPEARLVEVRGADHGNAIDRTEVLTAIRRHLRDHAGSGSPHR